MTDARVVLDGAMTEAEWQRQIVEYAELHGWLCYHTHDSRRSQAGYPDLTLVRYGRLVFAELKTQHGRVSREQAVWLNALEGTGARCYLWRPAQWQEVQEVLA